MRSRHRVAGRFSAPQCIIEAAREMRRRGFAVGEVYSPYPLEELSEVLDLRRSRLGLVACAGGVVGALLAIALQVGAAVVDWPLDVGGKPANSALAFLPITFELTVLLSGLAVAGAFFGRSRLFPGRRPMMPFAGSNEDVFILVAEGGYEEVLRDLLLDYGAQEVRELDPR